MKNKRFSFGRWKTFLRFSIKTFLLCWNLFQNLFNPQAEKLKDQDIESKLRTIPNGLHLVIDTSRKWETKENSLWGKFHCEQRFIHREKWRSKENLGELRNEKVRKKRKLGRKMFRLCNDLRWKMREKKVRKVEAFSQKKNSKKSFQWESCKKNVWGKKKPEKMLAAGS